MLWRNSCNQREAVKLNVGGMIFETHMATLRKRRNTMLARLQPNSVHYRAEMKEFFFDRDPILFRSILDFYRFDDLHFPHNICGAVVRRELAFWGIDEKFVSPCCWNFFKSCSDNEITVELLCEEFDEFTVSKGETKWEIFHSRIWDFLEDPASSTAAMCYSYWIGVALIISILLTVLASMETFTDPATHPRIYFNQTNNPKIMIFETRDPKPVIAITDMTLVVFFMIEFIIRAIVCPNKRTFFKNSLNIVEILAVLPKIVALALRHAVTNLASMPALYWCYCILKVFDIFRVVRALKYGKYYVGLRVLIVTLRASALDMIFLGFLIVVGAVMFGVFMYLCEIWATQSMPDMPTGTYWAFITMATVGYGDTYPETMQGRCVAIVCSLAGVLFTGLAVPIIANSFDMYYSKARLMLARHSLGYPIKPVQDSAMPGRMSLDRGRLRARTTLTAFRTRPIVKKCDK